MNILLTREEFRKQVLDRDKNTCIVCKLPGLKLDAHHIIERRLFDDGGYYIDNGVSLCGVCHLQAESTTYSCSKLRGMAGITNIVLPEHFYPDNNYDKWGNIILPNGKRIKGELFYDESVQKALKYGDCLDDFLDYVKYPRTFHVPFSEYISKDDKILPDMSFFEGQQVVVSVKLDGENSSIYSNYFHARSLTDDSHESRDWLKNFVSKFQFDIPKGWRLCGENLFAEHSIHYKNLKSYFFGFSIWNEKNICLNWNDTVEWFKLFGIESVPVIYQGIYDEEIIKKLFNPIFDGNEMEGWVIRLQNEFNFSNFRRSVAKFVRKNHNQSSIHNWKRQQIIKNEL